MNGCFKWMCALAAIAVAAVSCSKDDPGVGWIKFDNEAVFLMAGKTRTVSFSCANLKSMELGAKPDGWVDPVIDEAARTVTIIAPVESDEKAAESGTVTLTAVTQDGKSVKGSIFVGVNEQIDLSDKAANSYLLNRKNINYLIDVMHKGDGTTPIDTKRIELVWSSTKNLVRYLELIDGKASFLIEDDGSGTAEAPITEGNALIGAYNEDGILLWSWHIWAVDYDPDAAGGTVDFNGYSMMTYNLGALNNSNKGYTSDEQSKHILESYGLYYQWGRKDPFIGPSAYKGTGAATMYDASGHSVRMSLQESTVDRGKWEYTDSNPVTFLYAEDDAPGKDWMWMQDPDYNKPRWGETRTVCDPCPAGWRVAPAAAFVGLQIKEPLSGEKIDNDTYAERFGWTLTDGASEALFIGAGRRIYTNATIQNVYINDLALNPDPASAPSRALAIYNQPWVGLYWTADRAEDDKAQAFYFWFDKSNVTRSGVQDAKPYERANGMQVRCVREQ